MNIKNDFLPAFIKKHQLVLLAIIFFLVWKLTLVFILWQNRTVPPEPDDSYSYISTIASASGCEESFLCSQYSNAFISDYSNYIQFSYRVIFGGLARAFSLSPETTYEVSFYTGTILLAGVILIFIRSFTKNAILISLGIIFLALYHGNGEIHGFFWVVPSFFSVLFFFLIAAFIFEEHPYPLQYWMLPFLVPIFILIHPTSIYFLGIFVLYTIFQSILEKKILTKTIKKLLVVSLLGIITISLQSSLMTKNGQGDPYGIQNLLPQTISIFSKLQTDTKSIVSYDITENPQQITTPNKSVPYLSNRIETIKLTYLQWFFPHWIITLPFLFLLYLIYRNKQYKIISFYIAALLFFLASTLMNQFGFRSAIILWPATYLIYSFGLYYLIIFVRQAFDTRPILYRASIGIIAMGCIFFVLLNTIYAVTINTNANARNNYFIDKNFENYLIENTSSGDTVYIPRLVRQSIFGSKIFSHNQILPPEQKPKYIVTLKPKSFESSVVNQHTRSLINTFLSLAGKEPLSVPTPHNTINLPPQYSFDRSFGDVLIYRNISNLQ